MGNPKNNLTKEFFSNFIFSSTGCWIWTGKIHNGYGRFCFGGVVNSAHRFSWMIFKGEIEENKSVLHKCVSKNCLNPEHLYLGTQLENIHDEIPKNHTVPNKTSKFRGVHFRKMSNKWCAKIKYGGHSETYLGCFNTEEEAALAYNIEAKKRFGEKAYLNQL